MQEIVVHTEHGSLREAPRERFTVTEDHLKLLRSARLLWLDDGYGAPAIDPSQPYGTSAIEADIARILGKYVGNRGVLRAIHLQTKTVLQIALSTGAFEAGTYERLDDKGYRWRKI